MKQDKQDCSDVSRDNCDRHDETLTTRRGEPASSLETLVANTRGKLTDAHHHIYDSRYPLDPAAQLRPADATVADYRALQQRLGIGRHVVVQPSTYGTDNRCLLDALRQFGTNARGIASVSDTVTDRELYILHDAGVRGLRFNLEYLVGLTVAMIAPLSERIEPLGWHIQLNATAAQILEHHALLASVSSRLVIDHMGQIPQPAGLLDPAFRVVKELTARGRTWVKLSGPYLVSQTGGPDYADAGKVARSFALHAPDRMLWGTDWPHPTQSADKKPDAARLLEDLASWISDDTTTYRILVDNPADLYGF
ncbi:amidohydrolase family protein [Paraburkholderia sp. BL10I2N1]|uniref:amidohydrolase family protein n=1 Tax=Paraburkholderia sp. BL10I2N1 TaxID=1938796 RepID=UPI0010CE1774|nr:amidohydrolase family protein [Paraburkholderia sp. BL10I2N1]TDN70838.1 putative TIM-barrel fold metal-dependent hydrolase [Paraburkholderia sp. BL10I2N1]